MNQEKTKEQTSPQPVVNKKPRGKTDGLRVKRETKKRVMTDIAALNRKEFGRHVTADEYVSLAISLLKPEHLEGLKQKSLTNKDRMELQYQDYCTKHGKVSKDEFIGMLLSSGIAGTG